MLVACEALAVSAGLLLLPSGLIDVAFGTNLFIILAQAMFIAVILTAILTCMASNKDGSLTTCFGTALLPLWRRRNDGNQRSGVSSNRLSLLWPLDCIEAEGLRAIVGVAQFCAAVQPC